MAANLLALSPGNLSLIVSHVSYAGGRWIDCYSLATLARTCRQLWFPAVAELWRELDSFTPLLFTLPEDLYATTKQSQMDEMDMDDGALVYPVRFPQTASSTQLTATYVVNTPPIAFATSP
ncbi:hypothetical protein OH76DRAFT_1440069, partial [Lentinus brumalis]